MIDPAAEDPNRGYKMFEVDEVFLVYTPLAEYTIQKLIDASWMVSVEWREKIFWQLLEGIEYLHSLNVMHRDIKPLNMTLTSLNSVEPEARLIDLGSAQSGLQQYDYRVGTSAYIAPEMWAGYEGRSYEPYTEKVDIFAFGLSMYQFFCGQRCGWSRIDTDLNGNIGDSTLWEIEARVFRSDISPQLMEWVSSCMYWDPQHRPSAKELLELRDRYQSQRERADDCVYHDGKEDGCTEIVTTMERISVSGPEGTSHDGDPATEDSER